jgi:hypothetical protein
VPAGRSRAAAYTGTSCWARSRNSAGQDREHDQAAAERRAAVDPGGRAQAVG